MRAPPTLLTEEALQLKIGNLFKSYYKGPTEEEEPEVAEDGAEESKEAKKPKKRQKADF